MFNHHHIREGLKMLKRRMFFKGFKKFPGNDQEICKQIVEQCFNGTYFQTSLGHFNLFYLRDFAFCVESLMKLGYANEVSKTIEYALHCYATYGKLATTISRGGKPFDVFSYAVDSLPLLFHSLFIIEKYHTGKGKEFVEIYKPWLELEIKKFFECVIDPLTGLVKKETHFSSIKDHAKRTVSCYDICMCGLLSAYSDFFELANPLKNFRYPTLLEKYFWKDNHFVDSLESTVISGDANVFPYWTGLIADKEMMKLSMKTIQQECLDKPFPLKYTQSNEGNFIFPLSLFAGNYEGDSIWVHLGLCYLDVVEKVDKKLLKNYLKQYKQQIEQYKTVIEVFTAQGTPYQTLFYIADEGMLWAAKYLVLSQISKRTDTTQNLVAECDVDNDGENDCITGKLHFLSSHNIDLYLIRGGTIFHHEEYLGTISTAPYQLRIHADDVNRDGTFLRRYDRLQHEH